MAEHGHRLAHFEAPADQSVSAPAPSRLRDADPPPAAPSLRSATLQIICYAVIAAAWFLGAELVTASLFAGNAQQALWEVVLDWIFVLGSAVFFYALLRRTIRRADRAYAEVAQAEERFRSLVTATTAVVWRTDAEGHTVETTPNWSAFTGMRQEDPNGDSWFDAVHPNDRATAIAVWRAAVRDRAPYTNEYRLKRADGAWRDVLARGVPLFEHDGSVREWVGVCIDVTDRKAADEAIRLQARILDRVGEAVIATDGTGSVIYLNKAAEDLYGWSANEAIGLNALDLTVPVTWRSQAAEIMERVRNGATWSGEFEVHRRDGRRLSVQGTNTPLFNDAGELLAIIGVSRDLTERKAAERVIREGEQRFREIAENIDDVFWVVDLDRPESPYISPAYEAIWGQPLSAIKAPNFSFLDAVLPEDREIVKQFIEREQREACDAEYRIQRPDGSIRWIHDRAFPIKNDEGRVFRVAGLAEDITERKAADAAMHESERRLRALAERLASVRESEAVRIARELHDELGQALTGLTFDVAQVQRLLHGSLGNGDREAAEQRLQAIAGSLHDTIETTRRICTELRPALLDQLGLAAAIEWQAKEFEARTGILCDLILAEHELQISDAAATTTFRILQEVLTNVARHSKASEVRIELAARDGELRLEVSDNGSGITDAEKKSAVGLGLVGIRERALAVAGTVAIKGRAGEGTSVSVTLPLENRNAA